MSYKKHIDRDNNLTLIKIYAIELKLDAYLVGGYVRDLILNNKSKDIDIMTIGEPYSLISNLSKEIVTFFASPVPVLLRLISKPFQLSCLNGFRQLLLC